MSIELFMSTVSKAVYDYYDAKDQVELLLITRQNNLFSIRSKARLEASVHAHFQQPGASLLDFENFVRNTNVLFFCTIR